MPRIAAAVALPLVALAAALGSPALAQTPDDIAQLRRELHALRAEDAARARQIEQLQAEASQRARRIDDLARRLDAAAPPDAAEAPMVSAHQDPPIQAAQPPLSPSVEAEDVEAQAIAETKSRGGNYYGDFAPGQGFKIASTPNSELNISAYLLGRYINQLPPDQSFTTHLGEVRPVDTRDDLQLQRAMVWINGWAYDPKLHFNTILWTVNSTNQVAIAGALTYGFNEALQMGVGIQRLPGTYTMLGSFPYWTGTDRVMADEFFRPGMTSGIWATGEVAPNLFYLAMVGDNLSQLGINAGQLTRSKASSAALWWMPTTGEFGPRAGMGDYEWHERAATRFGIAYTHSREDRFSQPEEATPDNTQIRLSDSTLLFAANSLAPDLTVLKASYAMGSVSAGVKYQGWSLQAEAYWRRLSNFETVGSGVLPLTEIEDTGMYAVGTMMAIPKTLQLYIGTSQVFGQFNDASEYQIGANWFPFDTRNVRFNAQAMYLDFSAASSLFGYYVGGQHGPTVSLAVDLLY